MPSRFLCCLCNGYVIQDDNQIPYVIEGIDQLSKKMKAYIVPLEKHVFLDAHHAIGTCDIIIDWVVKNILMDGSHL